MTYKRLIQKAVKEANRKPMQTLNRIRKDRSLNQTEFTRYNKRPA